MKKFTVEEIQDRFEKLPKESQSIINSPEINSTIQSIGKKHGLLIDQIGELVDMIGLVILGLIPPKDFVKSFSEEAGISNKIASEVASDINKEILGKIRISMMSVVQNMEQTSANNTSSIEAAGNFTIEPESSRNQEEPNVSLADKDKILNDIENPTPVRKEVFTEPLVDQLLTGATTTTENKVTTTVPNNLPVGNPTIFEKEGPTEPPSQKPATPEKSPEPVQKPKGQDPYRELIT